MTSENDFLHYFTQLVRAWAAIYRAVARKRDEARRARERAQWEAKWASIIAAIDQSDVPQPVEVLSRLYLDLELTLRQPSDHAFRAIIRAHQQHVFAAICVAITAQALASESVERAQALASESVETLAILAQACMRERESAGASELPGELLACQRDVTEALRVKLKPSLIAMIFRRGWVTSWENVGIFDNRTSYPTPYSKAEALAYTGFGYVLENILRPRLDLDRNVEALLTTIAHRGITVEYRALRGEQTVPLTESPELAQDTMAGEILEHIADQQVQDAFWQYVDERLKPDEQLIIRRRWRDQPAASSKAIAEELGEGWNVNRVDVAHHRILKKIRRYLRSLDQDHVKHVT